MFTYLFWYVYIHWKCSMFVVRIFLNDLCLRPLQIHPCHGTFCFSVLMTTLVVMCLYVLIKSLVCLRLLLQNFYVYVHFTLSLKYSMSTSIANSSMSWYILFQCSYVYVSSDVFISMLLLHHFYVYVHNYNISLYHPCYERLCFSVLISTLVQMCLYLHSY